MYFPSLNQSIDVSTALTLGCLSSTILKTSSDCRNNCVSSSSGCSENKCASQKSESDESNTVNCPVSSCARLNLKLTAFSATVASGLYLYRAFVKN